MEPSDAARPWTNKTSRTLALFAFFAVLAGLVPGLDPWAEGAWLSSAIGGPGMGVGTSLTATAPQPEVDAWVQAKLARIQSAPTELTAVSASAEASRASSADVVPGPADAADAAPTDDPTGNDYDARRRACPPLTASETSLHVPCVAEDYDGTCTAYALDAFLDSLSATLGAEDHVTRVLHYGDSAIAADDITRTLRLDFQAHYGDAGPGFVYVDRPWEWYARSGLGLRVRGEWSFNNLIFDKVADGRYGLGGVNFHAHEGGVRSTLTLRSPRDDGYSFVELYYVEQPGGGGLLLRVNDASWTIGEEDPRPTETQAAFKAVVLDEPLRDVALETKSWRSTRVFGLVLETDRRGVVWDSIGLVGARALHLLNFDATHFKTQVQRRDPALVVLQYGLNEAQAEHAPGEHFRRKQRAVLAALREAAPNAACLVIGPYDNGVFEEGRLRSKPIIPKLVEVQRETALEAGCAFWDAWDAMGGEDSVADWYRNRPRLLSGDFTHLTRAGGEALGSLLSATLLESHERYMACDR